MKSSIFLIATSALLAMASPIRAPVEKRAMKTDWVYDYVTVTVTAGDEPTPTPAAVFMEQPQQPAPKPTTHAEPETTKQPSSAPPPQTSSGSGSSSGSSSSDLGDYENTMLHQHNLHRANHTDTNTDLIWDSTLASYASTTANMCKFAHDMHEGNGGYGQNLASWGSSAGVDGKQIESGASAVTEQWYNNEAMNYHWYGDSNPPSGANLDSYGHFSQMIWQGSTHVGCETVKCPAGTVLSYESWFTVCNYSPPGNVGGEYGSNVLPPKGEAPVTVSV